MRLIGHIVFLLAAHAEALVRTPRRYLTALTWRVLGKRVRARAQFAGILGQTQYAYHLWAMSKEDERERSKASEPTIIALIAVGGNGARVEETLFSLDQEGITAFVIGEDRQSDIQNAIKEIDWDEDLWLLPMRAGDLFAKGAADLYRQAIADSEASLIYADEDTLGLFGQRVRPYFKPSWNSELYRYQDYLIGSCIVRASRDEIFCAIKKCDWLESIVSDAVAAEQNVLHIKQILHHRQSRPAPRLPAPSPAIARDLPMVSVIIPTRNRVDLLSKCINGVEMTDYPSSEIIVVDNDSDEPLTLDFLQQIESRGVRVLRHPGPFNYSDINNRAVDHAQGDLICLLNNDIEVLEPDWLATMAMQALRNDVGAVGAKLLYPDGRIQHAGVVIGVGNAAGHAHRFLRPDEEGYFHRHSLPQFVSAVTAACLLVKRHRFLHVGGLDPLNFPVAFNDVDLCLKLNEAGWQSLYEPRAVLVHHESVSRGHDQDKAGAARFAGELAALQRLWKTDRVTDPYHHPELSRATEQFSIGLNNA